MGRRRTGSVYEKPSGSGQWWYSFLLRSGKRWAKPIPARPDGRAITEADARAYKDEVLRRYESGAWDPEAPEPAPAENPTVAEFARAWLSTLTHLAKRFEERIVENHILPSALGAMRLREVEPHHVGAWVAEIRQKPSQKGKGTLAPLTIRSMVHVLKKMFVSALFERKVAFNPCVLPAGIVPSARDKVVGARRGWRYTRDEVETLISDLTIPHDRRALYALLFLTGVRVGEVVVLRWSDVDSARQPLGCVTVSRAYSETGRIEKGTKTGAVREAPIHPTLAAALAEWKLSGWQRIYGRTPEAHDLIFPTRGMRRRHNRNVYTQLQGDCAARGIRPRRLHGTRATFISLGIDDGARSDVLAKITHTRVERSAFDVYRTEAWETLCAEVAKLRVVRRIEVLPLFATANGGPDMAASNTTNSATTQDTLRGFASPQAVFTRVREQARSSRDASDDAENAGIPAGSAKEGEPILGANDPSRSDSATTGSDSSVASSTTRHPVGPHTGEAFAYLWVEAILARGEEP